MYLGMVSDYGGNAKILRRATDLLGFKVGIFDGSILLVLDPPRKAISFRGEPCSIVSYHNGVYYGDRGEKFGPNDFAWVVDKEVPV